MPWQPGPPRIPNTGLEAEPECISSLTTRLSLSLLVGRWVGGREVVLSSFCSTAIGKTYSHLCLCFTHSTNFY